ncbi:MAG: ATP-binding protein [Nostoc sp.]
MSALEFLLLEANLPDAEVVQATLREGGIDCELLRVETRADFIRTLETDEIDLILADYALSNFDEIAALTIARRLCPEVPFIFISGSLGEELAIEAIKQGATDYVLKQRLGRLVPSVQRALQQAPELDKDATKRKQALSTIESDLKDTQLLHELSVRLVTEGDIQTLYQEIMAVAIALTRADAGTVQILDEATQELLLLATQGFEQNTIEHFYRVNANSNTPCGIALRNGERTFLDFDVPKSADPDGSMQMHLEAGYFSAQSTPLIARSGKPLGMVSTHWRKHHRPSDRQLRFLDLLARQAADLIEQRQAQQVIQESEALLQKAFSIETVGVLFFSLDGRMTGANETFVQMSGYSRDELLNTVHWEVLTLPKFIDVTARAAEELAVRGETAPYEKQMIRKDGSHWWGLFAPTRLTGSGSASECVEFIIDITESKQSELARRKSEEQFRLFVTASSNMIYRMSADWREMRNLEGKNILANIENPSRTWFETYIPLEERSHVWATIQAAIRTKSKFELEHRVIQQDGTIGWVFSRAIPMLNEQGEIVEWFGASSDITERKRAEEALRQSEAKYRSLFNSMDEGYFLCEVIFDENDRLIDLFYIDENPAAIHMTGQSFRGQRLREISPNYEEYWYEIFDRVAQTGQAERLERYAEPDQIWYDFYVFKVGSDDQRRVAVVFNDITNRKQAEAQLRRAAELDAFRVKLSDALRPLADSSRIKAIAASHLAERLNIAAVGYAETEPGGLAATITDEYNDGRIPSLKMRYTLSDFGSMAQRMQSGESVFFANHDEDGSMTPETWAAFAAINMRAGGAIPLLKGGTLAAYLFFAHPEPRDWMPSDLEILSETAERTWAAVERARAEAALQKSEIQRIQEQAAREEERQRAESLAELDRAKTLFFSNVSHEFRTPITLLLAPLQDALSDSVNPLTSSQRERLELAHRNSLRLLKLVNTLLDFSRIEADRLKANYEPTDLSTYTAELASVFRSAIENANLQLVVDCPPLPDPIYVDREMWEKIVLNLLSNALKFTFEGIISVSLKPKANTVELMVSDTGVGISPSELPHLFERFYQVKGAKGRSYEGSGIGLSLVQELVKRHGGAIAVTSAVDQGTTFTVTIPTGIAHLPAGQIWVASTLPSTAVTANAFVEEALLWLPEQEEGGRGQGAGGTALDESTEFQLQSSEIKAQSSEIKAQSSEVKVQSSKRARILLVDDNADMRGYLKRLLNQYYEVETVNDGLAALTAIRRGESAIYDLVLADVMMPRMDGFELLRSLRASLNTQTIPIILLSARAGEESRLQGLETGADDYLIKPFSARELLARVDANLKLAQLRREAVYREQVMQAVQTLNERLEQQVKARTAQLEAINQELEAFSSSVSHDLRTPLRYISSFAERLQGKLDTTVVDASSLQTLNIITKSALEVEKMVEDLLKFSCLRKTEMHLTTVNISQLVLQVREQLQPELIERSLDWQIEPLPMVEGDPTLLRLVLQNLLSNAVKYSRNNTEPVITIGSIEQEQSVIFFVKDNGAGFDMKYYDRLFSIFQRLHPQEQFPGTGVGLATVRRIVHRHGGSIWAEGAIDQGATFYFSLPKYEA